MNYKGFKKDMTCRGFQYEEGKEYEGSEASVAIQAFIPANILLIASATMILLTVYTMK